MTTEVFIIGLASLSVAAMIIVVMTTNKEERLSRDGEDRPGGSNLRTRRSERGSK